MFFIIFVCVYIRFPLIEGQFNFTTSTITLSSPTTDHFAAAHNNSLYIINDAKVYSTELPFNQNQWTEHNYSFTISYENTYGYTRTVFIQDQIYFINKQIPIFVLKLSSNDYSTFPKRPSLLFSGSCVVYTEINNMIYVLDLLNQRFNVTSHSWTTDGASTVSPSFYGGCSVSADGSNIYYFGGVTTSQDGGKFLIDAIEKYDISNDIWSVISNVTLSTPRSHLKCRLFIDDHIYCIGGFIAHRYDDGYSSDIVDIFDTSQDMVIRQIRLNTARYKFIATVWNDRTCLIVAGGHQQNSTFTGTSSARDSIVYQSVILDSIEYIGDCALDITPNPTLHQTVEALSETTTTNPTLHSTVEALSETTTTNPTHIESSMISYTETDASTLTSSDLFTTTHDLTVTSTLMHQTTTASLINMIISDLNTTETKTHTSIDEGNSSTITTLLIMNMTFDNLTTTYESDPNDDFITREFSFLLVIYIAGSIAVFCICSLCIVCIWKFRTQNPWNPEPHDTVGNVERDEWNISAYVSDVHMNIEPVEVQLEIVERNVSSVSVDDIGTIERDDIRTIEGEGENVERDNMEGENHVNHVMVENTMNRSTEGKKGTTTTKNGTTTTRKH